MLSNNHRDTIHKQQIYNEHHFKMQVDGNVATSLGNIICIDRKHRQRISIALSDKIVNSTKMAKEMEIEIKDLVDKEGTSIISDEMNQRVDYIHNKMVPEYEETLIELGKTLVCKT